MTIAQQQARSAEPNSGQSVLASALQSCRTAFAGVGLFSFLINLLMLTGPLFMLQVYDRVLSSRSVPTLLGLAILAGMLYLFQGILDAIRARVLLRIGHTLEEHLSLRIYDAVVRMPLITRGGGDGMQPMRDLDTLRTFLGGAGPSALFDLPWMPFYILICYTFHPWIGYAAAGGALILFAITLTAEFLTRGPTQEAVIHAANRSSLAEAGRRNAEVLQAMGMRDRIARRWHEANASFLAHQLKASDIATSLSSLSRVFRMLLQSLVLGLGAYLVIGQQASAGIIIASAILVSRALAPVELAVFNWKAFIAARESWKRLGKVVSLMGNAEEPLPLPAPTETLAVNSVGAVPPGDKRLVLSDINFTLKRGAGLGIIGPSGAGKSTLARLLVGVWAPVQGKIRLDGAALEQWSPGRLGNHIGYLPQDVELFDGTIAENIARFEPNPDPNAVLAASKTAGVHELILSLPNGYETPIGEAGAALSAGQRQRVALARALYRDPFLMVLDEPNSNLDGEGEKALTQALISVRKRGGIVIVIAHRSAALAAVDHVLLLGQGRQQALGPKDEVLRSVLSGGQNAPGSAPARGPAPARDGAKGPPAAAAPARGGGAPPPRPQAQSASSQTTAQQAVAAARQEADKARSAAPHQSERAQPDGGHARGQDQTPQKSDGAPPPDEPASSGAYGGAPSSEGDTGAAETPGAVAQPAEENTDQEEESEAASDGPSSQNQKRHPKGRRSSRKRRNKRRNVVS